MRYLRGAEPPRLLCAACAQPALARCARCRQALYCGPACQAAHWPAHKGPCRADSRSTGEAEALFFINHKCRHGGPDVERDPALRASLSAALGALGAMGGHRSGGAPAAAAELAALARLARAAPPPHAGLAHVLASCAVDAFADGNLAAARLLARAAAFLDAARAPRGAGAALLRGAEAALAGGGGDEGGALQLRELAERVRALASRSGLLAAVRSRMACACLTPCGPDALPLAEAPAGAAAGEGGARDLSVKELKAALAARGVPVAGLAEKEDLRRALAAAREEAGEQ